MTFPSAFSASGTSWSSLHISLSCWALVGSLDCGPFPAQVAISRAQIGLSDVSAPGGFATGGALTRPDPVRGTAGLSLHAFDAGGGVYRVALAVDGEEVSRETVDTNGGACADAEPANGDPYEFGAPQPCPLSVDGAVTLDTAAFDDGQHAVSATVEDAAGNSAVVFDGTVQTHNAPINAVAPALSGQADVNGTLTADTGQWDGAPTAFDHRWLRCDAGGSACVPVAGATGAAYDLTEADAYHRMRVEVTAENGSGAASARSAPTALVADAGGHTSASAGQQGAGQGGGGAAPSPGGIQGIVNPLGQLPGHVANGGNATARARMEAAFQRADGSTARRIKLRAGRRIAIVGRLTDASGAGIAGARVGAAWRIVGRGWVARPGVRTGSDGRFVYVLPAGPSRDVRFTYFAFSDSSAVELSNVVHVDALAPLTIRADRSRVTGDRVVRLSGRVGAHTEIPRTGLLVTLQGFQQGYGWRTFRTVRTDRHGRWVASYRFRSTHGRFGFRALVPRQGRFPFASSRSAGVFVVVA
ncbi:MAG TPA: carboxypeptidase-like regulatory domain-containing protein [Conexibacter sp.]|nr:carboxypeptidase-like regulatory domain-containing protein [Conexibacter sp.]